MPVGRCILFSNTYPRSSWSRGVAKNPKQVCSHGASPKKNLSLFPQPAKRQPSKGVKKKCRGQRTWPFDLSRKASLPTAKYILGNLHRLKDRVYRTSARFFYTHKEYVIQKHDKLFGEGVQARYRWLATLSRDGSEL